MEEPQKAQPSDIPDASQGSMAYMPQPDGAVEVPMNIGKKSSKEEKATMANLANKLAAEDAEANPKPVKIGVNGKATKPTPDEPKKVSKDEIKSTPEPIVQDVKLPPNSHNDAAPSSSHIEKVSNDVPRSGGKKMLVGLLFLSLIATGVLGYFFWQSQSYNTDLKVKLKDAEAKQTNSSSTSTATPAPLTSTSSTGKRLIPELGLSLSQSEATDKITYRYRESVDTDKKIHSVLTLSSTGVISAERAVSNLAPKCTAEFAPLGTLTSYQKGDTYKTAKIETQKVDQFSIFQIGEKYYVLDAAQTACSTDKSVVAAIAADKPTVTTFIKALEVK